MFLRDMFLTFLSRFLTMMVYLISQFSAPDQMLLKMSAYLLTTM